MALLLILGSSALHVQGRFRNINGKQLIALKNLPNSHATIHDDGGEMRRQRELTNLSAI